MHFFYQNLFTCLKMQSLWNKYKRACGTGNLKFDGMQHVQATQQETEDRMMKVIFFKLHVCKEKNCEWAFSACTLKPITFLQNNILTKPWFHFMCRGFGFVCNVFILSTGISNKLDFVVLIC